MSKPSQYAPRSGMALAVIVAGYFLHSYDIRAEALLAKNRPVGDITAHRVVADKEPGEWLTAGRDWRQSYYSPLTKIHKDNIKQLGFAWSYDIKIDTTLASTPIVVDGTMFTSGNRGKVYALDAKTGTSRWSFEPKVNPQVVNCCRGINRGVAVWREKVYVAATDGQLYALDAATGKPVWNVDTVIDHERSYSSTGAPYIAGNLVVIGNSGAEYDTRGYITAYDVETGRQAWRFFIVPGDPQKGFEHPELKKAAKTWDPNSLWEVGLGGNAWDGMAYDPKLNLLYVGTGNALPWNRKLRSPAGGDNLFLSSILAINPDTGRLVWHYQTTPGDNWDYNAAQKIILAELRLGGKLRQVLMQAPKNGFFYVLDRKTGELLSAEPYVYTNWASHVDMKTARPVETGRADYSITPKLVFPTNQGGHNWQPMAYNPGSGLVYIPTLEAGEVQGNLPYPFTYQKRVWNNGVAIHALADWENPECSQIPKGWPTADALRAGEPDPLPRTFLRAWDPARQKLVWQVETTGPIVDASYGARRTAGVMTTASGLVFAGDSRGYFRIFNAKNGMQLHSVDVGTSISAAPMTYTVDGEQYVAIMAGAATSSPAFVDYRHPHDGRIIALKLGGGKIPQRAHEGPEGDTQVPEPPAFADVGLDSDVESAQQLFERNCAACHVNTGRAPDLTRMTANVHEEFLSIVRGGTRAEKGMPKFGDVLTEQQAEAIKAYIAHLSWKRYRCQVKPNKHASPKVLVFSKVAEDAYRHSSIPNGIAAIKEIGAVKGWRVDDTIEAQVFNAKNLSQYDVIVWNNTGGDVLNAAEKAAFEDFIHRGGGYVGVHEAAPWAGAPPVNWPWYEKLVGANFKGHGAGTPTGRVIVATHQHPSTKNLPNPWIREDEWYEWVQDPSKKSLQILLYVDEHSYGGGSGRHPIAWGQEYEGGRAFYTALGHAEASYTDKHFRDHLSGAIEWASARSPNIAPKDNAGAR